MAKNKTTGEKMKKSTLYITRSALIAAVYVVLTMISASVGMHNNVIQLRFSEMLCILPVFFPEAVLGLTVGCFISNLISACALWDIIFGTIATFIGALFARLLSRLPHKLMWIATLPTVLANATIIPFVLIYAYGLNSHSYFFFALTVFIGEIICAGILGSLLYYTMAKYRR